MPVRNGFVKKKSYIRAKNSQKAFKFLFGISGYVYPLEYEKGLILAPVKPEEGKTKEEPLQFLFFLLSCSVKDRDILLLRCFVLFLEEIICRLEGLCLTVVVVCDI